MRLRTLFVALLFLALSAGQALRAQSFLIRRTGGSLSAGFVGLRQMYDTPSADRELFGRLKLGFTGYAGSPGTLRFSLELNPNASSLSASGYDNIVGRGNILGLNFSGRITAFESGLANVTAWGYRNDNKSLDPFGFRTELDGSGYGATLALGIQALPMSVYFLSTSRLQSLFRPAGFGAPNIFSIGRRELGWRASNSKLTARIRRTEDIFDGNAGTTFQEIFLAHRLQWGRGSSLRSRFTRTSSGRSGSGPRISRSSLVWDQRAMLRQAPGLSTDLFYRLYRSAAGGFASDGWAIGATERFRVNRPLSLFLSGTISGESGPGFSSSFRSITPGLDVTIPLPGRGLLTAGGQVSIADRKGTLEADVGIPVFGELHTVGESRTFLLEENSVDVSSIDVASRDGSQVYERDLDYRVTQLGQLTEIAIPFESRIEVGTTVSVDYRYRAPVAESDERSISTFYYGRIRFGSFEGYLRSRRFDTDYRVGRPSSLSQDRDQLTGGLRYALYLSRYASLNAFGEYHRSTTLRESYSQYVGGGGVAAQVTRRLAIGLNGTARGLDSSTGRGRRVGSITLTSSWNPLPRFRLVGGVSYNQEQQTELRIRILDTRFVGAYANAEWSMGLTSLGVSYSYGNWDDMTLDWSNSRLYVELRRTF